MKHIKISTEFSVSKLTLGTWQLADNHHKEENTSNSNDILHAYLEGGITSIATANIYQGVEAKIGRFIKKHTEEFQNKTLPFPQIMTLFTGMPNDLKECSETDILGAVDSALERLNINQIDLMQFFCWDLEPAVNVKIGKALLRAVNQGKIKALGVTNTNTDTLEILLHEGVPIVTNQIQYSLLDRRAETKMIPFCKNNNIATLAYGTMAGGFLNEKYLIQMASTKANLSLLKYQRTIDNIGGWDVFSEALSKLYEVAHSLQVSIPQLATSYILHQPTVASVLLGAHNTNHLDDSLAILDITLSMKNLATIESAISSLKQMEGDIYESELKFERKYGRLK